MVIKQPKLVNFLVGRPQDNNMNALSQHQEELGFLNQHINQIPVMVMETDACVEPRTMMVKPFHTVTTVHAMPRSASSDYFTIGAEGGAIEYFQQADELYSLLLDVAGVAESDDGEK
jgi:hypothetical protein